MRQGVRPGWMDGAVTVVVAFITGLDLWWTVPDARAADALSYALWAVTLGAVLARRLAPLTVTVVCAAVLTTWTLLGHRGELLNLATLVGLFTLAELGNRRRTLVVGAGAVAWSALLGLHVNGWSSAPVPDLLWPVVALLLGEVVRGRRELRREFADRELRAAALRERESAERVRAERLRVAREVHDIVAHTLTAVNVQLGVASAAFDREPGVARQALGEARQAGRDALAELRAAVALLREPGPPTVAEGNHSPGLADLTRLAAHTASAGVTVTIDDQTAGARMPAIVAATAYRIVQEALTNVIKHAHASTATVTLAAADGALLVEVVDDGTATTHDAGAGFGRTGMAERAAAIGGSASSGPAPGGGFRVQARLPIGPGEGTA